MRRNKAAAVDNNWCTHFLHLRKIIDKKQLKQGSINDDQMITSIFGSASVTKNI